MAKESNPEKTPGTASWQAESKNTCASETIRRVQVDEMGLEMA